MSSLYSLIDVAFDHDNITLPHNIYVSCEKFCKHFREKRLPTMKQWYEPGESPRIGGPIPSEILLYYQRLVVYEGVDFGMGTATYQAEGRYDWPTLFHITIMWQPLRDNAPVAEYAPSCRVPLGSFKTHDYGLAAEITNNSIMARRAHQLFNSLKEED